MSGIQESKVSGRRSVKQQTANDGRLLLCPLPSVVLRFALGVLTSVILFCSKGRYEVERTELGFGSYIRIRALGKDSTKVEEAVRQVFMELHRLESLWSSFLEESEVVRLNRLRRLVVSPLTQELILKALAVGRKTEGAFDITVEPFIRVWGFFDQNYQVPDSSEIKRLLSRVGYWQITKKGDTVVLGDSVNIDLGGIATGFAVDRAVEMLKALGVREGLVDIGGDIRVLGERVWRIGVQNPRGEGAYPGRSRGVVQVLKLKNQAVATSGDYERFFEKDGRHYCHIIDPRSGYPAAGCVAVTVIAPSALEADAYSTAVFVMGPDKGSEWVKREGLGAIIFFQREGSLVKIAVGRCDE